MKSHTLWGMVHVPQLPGSGTKAQSINECKDFCLIDAKNYIENGINHLFIENFGDAPFAKSNVDSHVISGLTSIIDHIKFNYPEVQFGVNVLRNDALSALAIATITNSQIIRVNILTHARLTDQGIIEGCSYELAKYKAQLQSKVKIWADINVKHSYPLAEIPLSESIHDTIERGGAEKIIFTGTKTGSEPNISVLKRVVEEGFVKPKDIVIGSGISLKNIEIFLPYANNFIVGTSLKEQNIFANHVDPLKVSKLVSKLP